MLFSMFMLTLTTTIIKINGFGYPTNVIMNHVRRYTNTTILNRSTGHSYGRYACGVRVHGSYVWG